MMVNTKPNYVIISSELDPRNESGKPVTIERNFVTNPTRTGQGEKSYFGSINSLATSEVKDQYLDPGRRARIIEN